MRRLNANLLQTGMLRPSSGRGLPLYPFAKEIALHLFFGRLALCLALIGPIGCAVAPSAGISPQIEVGFSPEAGSEALVVRVIYSARESVRLAAYSFTSPTVVSALMAAKRRGVDVKVLIDDRGNRGASSLAAIRLVNGAGVSMRAISAYAIHHDTYIVVDAKTTESGSFNYSQAAVRSNSENVLVVWNNPVVAARYLAQWNSRWPQGTEIEIAPRWLAALPQQGCEPLSRIVAPPKKRRQQEVHHATNHQQLRVAIPDEALMLPPYSSPRPSRNKAPGPPMVPGTPVRPAAA